MELGGPQYHLVMYGGRPSQVEVRWYRPISPGPKVGRTSLISLVGLKDQGPLWSARSQGPMGVGPGGPLLS